MAQSEVSRAWGMVLGGVETIKSSTGHQLSTVLLARVWYDPPPPMAHPPEAACACAQAADSHIFGRQIVASNHRKQVHRLRPADRAIQQRDAPVEGTGGSALSRVQERIRRSAMWAGKEGLARWFMLPGASRQLARAKAGRSPGFDGSKSRPIPPPRDLDAFGRVPVAVR